MSSIKKNFIYSSFLTVSNYIFPLITYPYVSRVLGVTNIGICNFVDSIINYYILISMMGISILGVREMAKSNAENRNKVFTNLFLLNGLSTFIALILLIASIFIIPSLFVYRDLLYIGIIKLLGNFFLIDWLYRGLEDFKYITRRTIFVKCIYVLSIYILIRKANDYTLYFLLSSLMIGINAILNWNHAYNKLIQVKLKWFKFRQYIRPFLYLGIQAFLTSMYTSFNVAYLGFVSNPTQVGYYTTATKLFGIILGVYSAFTSVMLPRMSSLISENRMDEFNALINKSISALLTISIPIIIFSCIFSPDIIYIIAGKGYDGAIMSTRIVMPLIFIIGYEQILVIQVLMALKKDKAILINSIIGASVGFLMNISLVRVFQCEGSAITWFLSEFSVLLSAQYFVNRYCIIQFPLKPLLKNIMCYAPIAAIFILYINLYNSPSLIRIFIAGLFLLIYMIIMQQKILRDHMFLSFIETIKRLKK